MIEIVLIRVISFVEFPKKVYNFRKVFGSKYHSKRKLFYFGNWCSSELPKSAKIWLSKSIFYVKNDANLYKEVCISLKDQFSEFWATNINIPKGHYCILWTDVEASCKKVQKSDWSQFSMSNMMRIFQKKISLKNVNLGAQLQFSKHFIF